MHKHFTWMSLWTCWYATALNGTSEKNFRSSVVTTLCALSTASPSSSQMVDEWESAFSFSLTVKCGLFEGVGISSIEVVGETVLAVLTSETMGVAEAIEVTDGPFPVTRTPFFLMLDSGSSFLDLIFAYISLLNLVVISTRRKHLEKKKNPSICKRINTDELNTYYFFLQCRCRVRRKETGQDQGYIEGKGLRIYQIVPTFDHQGVFYRLLKHAPNAYFWA